MKRINNTNDFVAKASDMYNNKYDYSKTEYVKSSLKVIIICPIHGSFSITPNKHLSGYGCPKCRQENRRKIARERFIQQAKEIHGDKYNYDKVVYQNDSTPVTIICPIHGEFNQMPRCHINSKQNCPKCGYKMAGEKRTGLNNVAHRTDVKKKKRETSLKRYGATTWSSSEEGRKIQRNLVLDSDMLERMQKTCQRKYGYDFWTQSEEGRIKLVKIMNDPLMKAKIKLGYEKKYGCHYMQTEEGRKKAQRYIDDDRRKKMRKTMMKRYGHFYAGAVPLFQKKAWETKRRNGTFNTSRPEETLYLLLCDVFGRSDVEREYKDDLRYPFFCDFYIKSLDLFIEFNAHWTHGGHFFNPSCEKDQLALQKWVKKSKTKGSRYYHSAINIWTKRDLLKRDTAIKNHLNYVVFWKSDLSDARTYLSNYSRP